MLTSEERRARILAAAEKTFMTSGYGRATMEEIARNSGMSKKTLYQFFSDKAQIFEALVEAQDLPPRLEMPAETGRDDLTETLRRGLVQFASYVLSGPQIALTRLVISEASHHPEMSRLFFGICVERGRRQIAEFIGHFQKQGLLAATVDAETLADVLVGGTFAMSHLSQLMMGNSDVGISTRTLERDIGLRLNALLQGFLPETGPR
ncbi:TetR/AcrR family transcriptional regulator [Rhizobium sp. NRK18]|uniref:TetR/AcrR family transcriptional regulator n=1 Tax=Rhizobium sp. NRK18 TaxID=2964667 RepID=UPI0021C4B5C4|nr:TetR/AcrR family transcriptional regulator [Rhizobium sp. NRK18]MCQ2004482.1 TetR/AcrR family transcriptional regulator [Rhizobium sp. NRK18]